MSAHTSTVWSFDFDPTGSFLASCSEDKTWILWRISDESYKKAAVVGGDHIRAIYSISWAPKPFAGHHFIATGGSDNQICIYKIPEKELK